MREDWVWVRIEPDDDGMVRIPKERYDRIQDLLVTIASTGVLDKNDAEECYDALENLKMLTRTFVLGWESK